MPTGRSERCAWRLKRAITPRTPLGAFYRRIQARRGGPKAVTATARKIAQRVYRPLKYGQAYAANTAEAYRLRTIKAMARKAESLSYKMVPASMPG